MRHADDSRKFPRFDVAVAGMLACMLLGGCAPDLTARMLTEGWQQLQANQPERALTTAENVLTELPPGSSRAAEALYLKGRALEARPAANPQEQRNHLTNAFAAYTAALSRSPRPPLEGRIYAGLGNVCYWLDDYTSAWRNWATAYDLTDDVPAKAFVLYRIGLCQQRLGRFAEADRTFAAVQQEFAGTDAAQRARQKQGIRTFAVQVATFANAQSAENAMNTLRREGYVPTRTSNASGQSVVSISPFADYQQARNARDRLAGLFPDALVIP